MNLRLQRDQYTSFGIFGTLSDESGQEVARTLEHSFLNADEDFEAKIPDGIYACKRGAHELSNLEPFETFEITGVSGHTGLLFHAGNFNRDSEGCILVGEYLAPLGSEEMLKNSRSAFMVFMNIQSGIDEFTLTIVA